MHFEVCACCGRPGLSVLNWDGYFNDSFSRCRWRLLQGSKNPDALCCSGRRGTASAPYFRLKFDMIHRDPTINSATMNTPKAKARTLLMLSGPVVMWRKSGVDAHLRNRENEERNGDTRFPDE